MALTSGGPGYSTESLSIFIYRMCYGSSTGYSTAVSLILFFLILVPVALSTWFLQKRKLKCEGGIPYETQKQASAVPAIYPHGSHRRRFVVPVLCACDCRDQSSRFSVLNGDVFAPTLYFENYKEAWDVSHLGSAMMNSLTITGGSLFILLFVSANAAYAISRFPNKLNRSVYTVFMLGMMIPPIVNTVPLYTVMQRIGGINTRWAMILLMAANCMPLTTFLYVGFIRAIPRQFEEAAILDGCSWHGAFWRVIFPQLKPVTATAIIMNGVSIWNNYGQAIFFLQKRKVHTIPISISIFTKLTVPNGI